MALLAALAFAAAASAGGINATFGTQSTLAFSDSLLLCNSSFAAANASGVFYTTPMFNKTAKYGTAFALAQNQKKDSPTYGLQASLMFSPLGQNYFNDTSLGYDVCGFAVNILALSSNTWLRGQSDNGSCLQTFDSNCMADLRTNVNNMASNPDASSSNSAICQNIYDKMNNIVPASCSPYLLSGASFLNGWDYFTQAPGTSDSALNSACTLSDNGTTWYNLITTAGAYTDYAYDLSATITWPVMTVFLPLSKNSMIANPHTDFSCLHINKFSSGSRVTNITATPTPVAQYSATTTSGTNSKPMVAAGVIAGAIVAAIALLGLVALGMWWFWLRKRTQKKKVIQKEDIEPEAIEIYTAEAKRDRKYSEAADTSIVEMSPDSYKAELPTHFASELQGDHHYELDGGRFVHELPAESVDAKIR